MSASSSSILLQFCLSSITSTIDLLFNSSKVNSASPITLYLFINLSYIIRFSRFFNHFHIDSSSIRLNYSLTSNEFKNSVCLKQFAVVKQVTSFQAFATLVIISSMLILVSFSSSPLVFTIFYYFIICFLMTSLHLDPSVKVQNLYHQAKK